MKKLTTTLIALSIVMVLPMTVFAMSHANHGDHAAEKAKEMDHKGHDMMNKGQEKSAEMKHHGDMAHEDMGKHKGHDMAGANDGFAEFGKGSSEGVNATAKIKAYDAETRAAMAKVGVDATHHIMVFFADEKAGTEIAAGKVALKVKTPGNKVSEPIMLMQMGKGFGADVTISETGMYTFELGTKLGDDVKRQFSFTYHNH